MILWHFLWLFCHLFLLIGSKIELIHGSGHVLWVQRSSQIGLRLFGKIKISRGHFKKLQFVSIKGYTFTHTCTQIHATIFKTHETVYNTLQRRVDLWGPKELWFIDVVELELDLGNDEHLIMASREEEGHSVRQHSIVDAKTWVNESAMSMSANHQRACQSAGRG